jgi:hypothetical protein
MNSNGEVILKPINEWDNKQKKRYSHNAKAMNAFFYALNLVGSSKVKNCKTTLEDFRNYP